jgi:selenocysteine lyase/cysteine desulfurase
MTWTHHPPPPSIDALLSEVLEFEASLLEEEQHQPPDPSPGCSYLNHGGFGDPHPSVLKLRQYFTDLCYRTNENCTPMVYHRSLVPKLVARAKARACDYLSISSPKHFSFCSITSALFRVLDSVKFEEGDVIVTTDTIYHSLVDTISHVCNTKKLKWVVAHTSVGCDSERIFDDFKRVITSAVAESSSNHHNHRVKLAVMDHISSKPTILYPVNRMCDFCQSLQIPTLVDGAHVPGSIPSHLIRVEDTMATVYVVTFHKWCNTPRGASGGIWVNQSDIDDMYSSFIDVSSLVVGGGWHHNQNNDNNMYVDASKPGYLTDGLTQGIYDESTREYENILVLPLCLDLVLKHEDSFQQHAALLRAQSMVVLRNAWGLDEEEAQLWGGAADVVALPMLAIPLPTSKLLQATTFPQHDETTVTLAKQLKLLKAHLVLKLWQEYAIEVPVFVWKNEIVGVRISFGRKVVIQDIERLGDAINRIIERGLSL